MKFFLQLPVIRSIHERQLLLPAVIGAAVLGVLLHGAFRNQDAAEASDEPLLQLPVPPSLPDLRPRLEKSPLTYLSDYHLQLGEQAKNKFVLIGQGKQPGLVVTPGVVLTSLRVADNSIRPLQHRVRNGDSRQGSTDSPDPPGSEEGDEELVADVSAVEWEESARPLPLAAVDAELGIALFEMELPYLASPFSLADPTALLPGSVVLAVTLLPDGALEIIPGYLASPTTTQSSEDVDSLQVSLAFPEPPAVAAIVDLDGRFVGAAIESGGGVRLLSSNTILRFVDRLGEDTPCRAIQVSDLPKAARNAIQLDGGVLVEKVLDEAFVPEPSVRPGDILLQWDGEAISEAEQFYSLYDKNQTALVRYRVLRDQKQVSGATVVPGSDCRPMRHPPMAFPALGLTLRWVAGPAAEGDGEDASGWKVLHIDAESLASSAGMQPGDRIVALNAKHLDETGGAQRLRTAGAAREPFFLTFHRGDRVKLATVEPEPE